MKEATSYDDLLFEEKHLVLCQSVRFGQQLHLIHDGFGVRMQENFAVPGEHTRSR